MKTDKSSLQIVHMDNWFRGGDVVKEVVCKLEYEIKPEVIVFGKVCSQQRDVVFLCNDPNVEGYKYSGNIMRSKPMPGEITQLMNIVNKKLGSSYNAALCNRYNNGCEVIGAHSDDELNLDPNTGVLSISFGATRTFRLKTKTKLEVEYNDKLVTHHKTNETIDRYDIKLTDGIVCLMSGSSFQKEFTHEIPAEKKVKEPRWSITFRCHKA